MNTTEFKELAFAVCLALAAWELINQRFRNFALSAFIMASLVFFSPKVAACLALLIALPVALEERRATRKGNRDLTRGILVAAVITANLMLIVLP